MLALLIYRDANGLLSSRRIERATYRDIGVRLVAANLHPAGTDNDVRQPKERNIPDYYQLADVPGCEAASS